jgi:hypothetical protein
VGCCIKRLGLRAEVVEEMAKQRVAAVALVVPLVVEVDLLAECVGALLAVEPGVQQHRLAAARVSHSVRSPSPRWPEKRAHALGIVGADLLADVVGVASVAVGIAAQAPTFTVPVSDTSSPGPVWMKWLRMPLYPRSAFAR